MSFDLQNRLVVGISSMALFDLEEADQIFRNDKLSSYIKYQRDHENETLNPGTGFPLVKALLLVNERAKALGEKILHPVIEVVVMSRNGADSGLRIFNSIEAHKLPITRAAFRAGRPITPFLKPFEVDLFLSASTDDVQEATKAGFAAGRVYKLPEPKDKTISATELRIAFDGDAVLFSPESEQRYKEKGLEAFCNHEQSHAEIPLEEGPFAPLAHRLSALQILFRRARLESPIRTALVTARNAPAHKRVILTLRNWKIDIDEAFFLGGVRKDYVLEAFAPHIYFDDQKTHCNLASCKVPTAHVPSMDIETDPPRGIAI